MKNVGIVIIIILLITAGVAMFYFKSVKKQNQPEPKRIIAKFTFGKKGEGLGEFKDIGNSCLKENLFYVADLNNHRIQVLEINPDGSLTPKFTFGKKGEGLGEFSTIGTLVIRGDYLYVADLNNHRIQVLEINPDGSLTPKFTFGKKGEGLGEFSTIGTLVIRGDYLYVADLNNHRIQVLEINPDGSLTAFNQLILEKNVKGPEEFEVMEVLTIKKDYLYIIVTKIKAIGDLFGPSGSSGRIDLYNHRIQVLEINPDGSLTAFNQLILEKNVKGLGPIAEGTLLIKGDYLYAINGYNQRAQILKVNPDGSLSTKFTFGKKGQGLGEFLYPKALVIKGNYLYVADKGNDRIQVFEIKY